MTLELRGCPCGRYGVTPRQQRQFGGGGKGEDRRWKDMGVKSGHVSSRSGRKVGWEGSKG